VFGRLCPFTSPPSFRRSSHLFLERATECGRALVADIRGDLVDVVSGGRELATGAPAPIAKALYFHVRAPFSDFRLEEHTLENEDGGRRNRAVHAYLNERFVRSASARALRILSEYLEPKSRFDHFRVDDTIVFLGSARIPSRERAEKDMRAAGQGDGDPEKAQRFLELSRYYEGARELAERFTEWSKQLEDEERRFVVCTGGGPGIMEAANRGASEARGVNVGLAISIPAEEFDNPYVTRELDLHFHYFFMRKFWLAYLAKAVIVFPGGFGTLDELFEILTLLQTHKIRKHLPVVLFGTSYWDQVINFDALARHGMIDSADVALFHRTDSVEDAFEFVTGNLKQYAIDERGAIL